MPHSGTPLGKRLDFPDAVKALALAGILLNHLVEEFGPGPWFTNPANGWPAFAERMRHLFPGDASLPLALIRFLGWLGDSCPGVFLLMSGFGLTWSLLRMPAPPSPSGFYARRLTRIFPLYWAAHALVLAGAAFLPGAVRLADRATLLSLAGLRFTPSLFFHINPSWWFIWTLIQLYAAFPFLYRYLRAAGPGALLVSALGLTLLSRAAGILFSDHLYAWMTGLFAGTRLAEFCAGMAAAAWLAERRQPPSARRAAALALPTYLAGFACSLTLWGSLASNLLVTLGLTGLFYAAWEGFLRRSAPLARAIAWAGAASFGVYLIHQPFLKWTALLESRGTAAHGAAALAVIALSFPAARLLERGMDGLLEWRSALSGGDREGMRARVGAALAALALVAWASLFFEPDPSERRHALFCLFTGLSWACLACLAALETPGLRSRYLWATFIRWAALASIPLQLWAWNPGQAFMAALDGALAAALALTLRAPLRSAPKAWAVALACTLALNLAGEFGLSRLAPMETGRWGELPALEARPDWVYGLKPGFRGVLHYNDYRYEVRANSLGLPGPEIPAGPRPTGGLRVLAVGDAFTMPEGLPYGDGYPAVLQDTLRRTLRPRAVEVIDAGITGYGPNQVLAQLGSLLPLVKPDVVVYQFFVNEFTDVNLTAADFLEGIGLKDREGSRIGRVLADAQLPARAARIGASLRETATGEPAPWRHAKALLPYYQTGDAPRYGPANLARMRSVLARIDSACRADGARLAVFFVPGAVEVMPPASLRYFPWTVNLQDTSRFDLRRPYRALLAASEGLAIPVIDSAEPLRRHAVQPVYFPGGWHWTGEGHKAAAQAMARYLEGLGLTAP